MSARNWTPRPWLLNITAEHGTHLDVTGTGGRIGQAGAAGRIAKVSCIPESWGAAQANARLIAAAPELYEALAMVAALPGFESDEPYGVAVLAALKLAEDGR